MNRIFQQSYHITGTLTANVAIRFVMPCNAQLVHVGAVASNNSDATIKIGNSSDDDGFLTETTIGDSGTPAEFDLNDWNGALVAGSSQEHPRLNDGEIVVITIDYDGSSGTAAQNLTLVLTLEEG